MSCMLGSFLQTGSRSWQWVTGGGVGGLRVNECAITLPLSLPTSAHTTHRRFDQFNVRLRLALFDSGTANRCRLVSLAPSPTGEQRQQASSITYRGPTVGLLQPGGIASSGKPAAGAQLHSLPLNQACKLRAAQPALCPWE